MIKVLKSFRPAWGDTRRVFDHASGLTGIYSYRHEIGFVLIATERSPSRSDSIPSGFQPDYQFTEPLSHVDVDVVADLAVIKDSDFEADAAFVFENPDLIVTVRGVSEAFH